MTLHAHTAAAMLARTLAYPGRTANVERYQATIGAILDAEPSDEQDGLALFEALAMLLGELTSSLTREERRGAIGYVACRAHGYAEAEPT